MIHENWYKYYVTGTILTSRFINSSNQ